MLSSRDVSLLDPEPSAKGNEELNKGLEKVFFAAKRPDCLSPSFFILPFFYLLYRHDVPPTPVLTRAVFLPLHSR